VSNLYDEREQYLKMKEQMKDSMKLRAKRKGKVINATTGVSTASSVDHYLTLAKDQQRVRKALYKMVIQGLFVIVFGIVVGIVIYSL
jgi:hypothetical protein